MHTWTVDLFRVTSGCVPLSLVIGLVLFSSQEQRTNTVIVIRVVYMHISATKSGKFFGTLHIIEKFSSQHAISVVAAES